MIEHDTSRSWVTFFMVLSVNKLFPVQFVTCPTKKFERTYVLSIMKNYFQHWLLLATTRLSSMKGINRSKRSSWCESSVRESGWLFLPSRIILEKGGILPYEGKGITEVLPPTFECCDASVLCLVPLLWSPNGIHAVTRGNSGVIWLLRVHLLLFGLARQLSGPRRRGLVFAATTPKFTRWWNSKQFYNEWIK